MRKPLIGLVAVAAAVSVSSLGAPAANAVTWCAPVVLSSGTAYTEPGVDVDPSSGTIYVNAISGIPSWSTIWKTNGNPCTATTWSSSSPLTNGRATCLGGGDSDLAVQSDGTLSWTDLYLGSSCVGSSPAVSPLTSMDRLWVAQPYNVPVQDRQWLAAAGKVTYFVTHQLEGGLVVTKSFDGGITYPQHGVAATVLDQLDCLCPPGNIVARHGTGNLLGVNGVGEELGIYDRVGLAYTTGTGVNFARSDDGGLTFQKKTIDAPGGANTSEAFPVVATDGANRLHAVWAETTGTSGVIQHSMSTDFGNTWSTPTTIVSGGSSIYPWVAVQGNKVAVAYYHTATAGNPSSVGAGATWQVKYVEGTYTGGTTTTWGTVQSPDTTTVKNGNICTDGLNCSSGRELGDFLQVAIRNNGTPIISYIQATGARQVRIATG